MITRLQNFFLKHNKWLFGGLLIVIIVTFVLTIGPQSFFGSSSGQQRSSLKYYGYDLSSQADQRAISMTAEISAVLHPELQVRREQLMDYAYLRIAALGMARNLGIPDPDKAAIRSYVETLGMFQDPTTGAFSAETYNNMISALQANGRYTRESIAMVLREDYKIAEVRKALGGPAYSLPFELKNDYLDQQTGYTLALATFDYANFNPEIQPTEDELKQFYDENPSRYEIPETISVTALLFKSTAYLDEVPEPDETAIEEYFTANKARYQMNTPEAASAEVKQEITLDEARGSVIRDWKKDQAKRVAAKKSEQFSLRLWQDAITLDSDTYKALLEEFKVEKMPVPPYSRDKAPNVATIPTQLLNSMWIFTGNPNRYFSDIAQTRDGAAVLVANNLEEARMPEFAEVKEKVLADYTAAEKRRLFAEKGTEIRTALKEALANETIEEAASSLGLEVETLDPFTGENIPVRLRQSTLFEQARFLNQGDVSKMILQANTGTFVYVVSKSSPQLDPSSEDYLSYVAQRESAMNEALGWARLREITDESLNALLGPSTLQ